MGNEQGYSEKRKSKESPMLSTYLQCVVLRRHREGKGTKANQKEEEQSERARGEVFWTTK